MARAVPWRRRNDSRARWSWTRTETWVDPVACAMSAIERIRVVEEKDDRALPRRQRRESSECVSRGTAIRRLGRVVEPLLSALVAHPGAGLAEGDPIEPRQWRPDPGGALERTGKGLRDCVVGDLGSPARIGVDAAPELRAVVAVDALDRFPGR